MQSFSRLRYTGHIEEILSLTSIFSRGVTQTLESVESLARLRYTEHIEEMLRLASIFGRVTQTLEQCKAWPG